MACVSSLLLASHISIGRGAGSALQLTKTRRLLILQASSSNTSPIRLTICWFAFRASTLLEAEAEVEVEVQAGLTATAAGWEPGAIRVLINGRRIAGKGNEGNQQLSRIPATDVQYIEIIRGTSGDLDVRGGSQVINIVLLEAESSTSYAYEINLDNYHDGKYQPGGKFAITGQNGGFTYFLSAELEPRWEFRDGFEESFNVDGSLNEIIDRDQGSDAWPTSFAANLGYEFDERNIANLNFSADQQ